MLKTIGVLIISGAILFFQIPKLLKHGEKKEKWTFYILLFISTTLSIAVALNVKVPNPVDLITIIYKPVSEFLKLSLK